MWDLSPNTPLIKKLQAARAGQESEMIILMSSKYTHTFFNCPVESLCAEKMSSCRGRSYVETKEQQPPAGSGGRSP